MSGAVQQALLRLREMQARLEALERARNEPIAIVGLACRLPGGADGPDAFWRLLADGRTAFTPAPPERWGGDGGPGAFLGDVARFDNGHFGIGAHEAARMDPQQRLFLEVACEALDDAGLPAARLAGSRTGVFLGIYASEYFWLQLAGGGGFDAYTAVGNAHSLAAARVSNFLDLRGPSLAVDSTCSSSLVAVHLACQSLRAGECGAALAGGVSLMLSPLGSDVAGKALPMAADGRCRPFDARAGGVVRGEGCAAVVLKRLSDAQASGDRIWAVIRGSAVNQDGRTGAITAPNPDAQRDVLKRALHTAGVDAARVGYLEAHGTGTAVGDPVELESAAAVYGAGDTPCAIGAVKANLGHLEAAAGVTGLVKAVLCLHHGQFPPQPDFGALTPHARLDGTRLTVPAAPLPWPRNGAPRLAAVSAFSLGGTNAHVVLEEAPDPLIDGEAGADAGRAWLLPLSARTPAALRALAERWSAWLADGGRSTPPRDLCWTAAVRRSHHPHRLALAARSHAELRDRLRGWLAAPESAADGPAQRVIYLLPPSADGWGGAAAGLMDEPAFRDAVRACDAAFVRQGGEPMADAVGDAGVPGVFALQVGIVALWKAWGVAPDAVLGIGPGEIAAAYLGGALDLDAAARVALRLGDALRRVRGGWRPDGNPAAAPLRAQLSAALAELRPAAGAVPAFCATTGGGAGRLFSAEHWAALLSDPARIDAAAEAATRGGPALFLQIGASASPIRSAPVLSAAAGGDPRAALLSLLGALYQAGREVEWPALWTSPGRVVSLPAYPWQGERHWLPSAVVRPVSADGNGEGAGDSSAIDPINRIHSVDLIDLRADGLSPAVRPEVFQPGAISDAVHANGVGEDGRPADDDDDRAWYRVEWVPSPLPEHAMDAAGAIAERLRRRVAEVRRECGVDVYDELGPRLDDLSAAYARRALAALGDDCVVAARFDRLLARVREMAADGESADVDPDALLADLRERFPQCAAELELVGRCGPRLAEVLGAARDPLELLFPGGSMETAERLYRDSPFARACNALVAQAVAAIVAGLPADGPVRVLEIGAGTGGTTAHVLPLLPPEHTEYLFTDVSPHFTTRAARRFRDFGGVRGRVLNIERDPVAQGFEAASFDVVIAANVLHATADLRRAVEHARLLLCPGGALVLLEGTRAERWLDLTFGLTDGWWRFTDTDLRADHPLLTRERWLALLADAGFTSPAAVPDGDAPGEHLANQVVLIARAPGVDDAPAPAAARRWLVLADRGGVGDGLARLARARGEPVRLLHQPQHGGGDDADRSAAAPDPAVLERALRDAADGPGELSIIHLWALDDPTPRDDGDARVPTAGCESALLLMGATVRSGTRARLWIATRGVHPSADAAPVSIQHAPLWGLARVMAGEHPGLWGGIVDLEPGAAAASTLHAAITAGDGEDQVAFRDGIRHVARLVPLREMPGRAPRIDPAAAYLVTGGLGGVGLAVAEWLVGRGARQLVLAGRHGADASAEARVDALRAAGAEVRVERADVADPAAAAALVGGIAREGRALRGVIHAAGVFDERPVDAHDADRLRRVLAPKVDGAWNLHRLTAGAPLDFFVLFSSSTALLGPPGLAGYAAANAFLDALARHRRARGLRALSIGWCPWERVGMAHAVGEARQAQWKERGVRVAVPGRCLRALERALGLAAPHVAFMPMDWPAYAAASPGGRVPAFLSLAASSGVHQANGNGRGAHHHHHPPHTNGAAGTSPGTADGLPRRLAAAFPGERRGVLMDHLRAQAVRLLDLGDGAEVDPHTPLAELGMDSLAAIELRNALSAALAAPLPATLLLEHPTLDALCGYLSAQVLRLDGAVPAGGPA